MHVSETDNLARMRRPLPAHSECRGLADVKAIEFLSGSKAPETARPQPRKTGPAGPSSHFVQQTLTVECGLSGDLLRGTTYSNPARAPTVQGSKQLLRASNARGEDDVDGSNRRRTEKRTAKGHMRAEQSLPTGASEPIPAARARALLVQLARSSGGRPAQRAHRRTRD